MEPAWHSLDDDNILMKVVNKTLVVLCIVQCQVLGLPMNPYYIINNENNGEFCFERISLA